ncbi:MAG TPA: hypothetical protein VFR94_17520 [Nitrososphaeraceae archaeon]|nr:hypothetical protein [Nitrososphaeraceae archaeon]
MKCSESMALHQKLYLQYNLITEVTTAHHKRRKTKSSHAHHRPSERSKDLLSDAYRRLSAGQPVVAGHAGHEGPFESVREVDWITEYSVDATHKSSPSVWSTLSMAVCVIRGFSIIEKYAASS